MAKDKYPGTNLLSKDFTEEDANKALLDLLKKTNEVSIDGASALSAESASILALLTANGVGITELATVAAGTYVIFKNKLALQFSPVLTLGVVNDSVTLVPRYYASVTWIYPKPFATLLYCNAELSGSIYHDAYGRALDTVTPLLSSVLMGACNRAAGLAGVGNNVKGFAIGIVP
jgi:hypothetical protein